jgi:hypothetical protein
MYLRVGMDTGVGGCVGPIFRDNKFEYIPIPDLLTSEKCTYRTCEGRHGHFLSTYVPKRLYDKQLHYDPDFRSEIPVFCDATSQKARYLRLNLGDVLVFYAGLTPWNNREEKGSIALYFIGYLEVEKVVEVDISNILNQPPNAHTKRFQEVKHLGDSIANIHNMNTADLLDYSKSSPGEITPKLRVIIEDFAKRYTSYRGSVTVGHSRILKLEKGLEPILRSPDSWKSFFQQLDKSETLDIYAHIVHAYSEFVLVRGTTESRLLEKAIRISNEDERVLERWDRILGIKKGLSLRRKNPRFVPNLKNGNGSYEELREALFKDK